MAGLAGPTARSALYGPGLPLGRAWQQSGGTHALIFLCDSILLFSMAPLMNAMTRRETAFAVAYAGIEARRS